MFAFNSGWLKNRALGLAILIFSLSGSAVVSLLLGQSRNWDLYNYHYYAGYAILNSKVHYDFAPAQVQSFFNPLIHIPTYLMAHYLPGEAMALLLGAIQGLNFWLVYRISGTLFVRLRPLFREGLSLTNAAIGYYGAANISEVGAAMGDNLVSILILAALLTLVRHIQNVEVPRRPGRLKTLIAGFAAGAAVGLKLTSAIYILPMMGAFLIVTFISRKQAKPFFIAAAGILLGFLVSYGYWGMSLYRQYENPFFPNFNNIVRSKYFDQTDNRDPRFLPRSRQQALFYPFYFIRKNVLVGESIFRSARLAACYLLVAALLIYWGPFCLRRRPSPGKSGGLSDDANCLVFLALFMTLSYVLWQQMFSIYRYTVSLELMAPVFLSFGSMVLLRGRRVFLLAAALMNLVIGIRELPLDFGRYPYEKDFLMVRPPAWDYLDESVVLMSGSDAYAYIIPSFPRSTRFVRVESNFTYPGRNYYLEKMIGRLLEPYSEERTLAYLYNKEELGKAGPVFRKYAVAILPDTCTGLEGISGNAGYLCKTTKISGTTPLGREPGAPAIKITPRIVETGKDTLVIEVFNLHAESMDILYTIDGQEMPPIRNWRIDEDGKVRVFVSGSTRKGVYRYIGIRPGSIPDRQEWTKTDVEVIVK